MCSGVLHIRMVDVASTLVPQGQTLLQGKWLGEASEVLESALEVWPESGCVHMRLGSLRMQQGRDQEVSLDLYPPDYLLSRSHTHSSLGA